MEKTIVFLGWADLDKKASQGGGYNLIAAEHAQYLAEKGGRVLYLQSGISFNFNRKKTVIKKSGSWSSIECYKLFNSSCRAPAVYNHYNKKFQIEDSKQNLLVCNWLIQQKAEIVYIHSLEGHPLSLIQDIKKYTTTKIAVIIHDHFYICPHVKLLGSGNTICIDYKNGYNCENCIRQEIGNNYELRMALRRFPLLRIIYRLSTSIKRTSAADCTDSIDVAKNPNKKFLEYINCFGDNFYAARRRGGIEALKAADKVFSPSGFIAEYLQKCGLSSGSIHVFRTGLPHLDNLKTINRKQSLHAKITFCCTGSDLPVKGVLFFINTLLQINIEIRDKCRFIIKGIKAPAQWKKYKTEIPQLEIEGIYSTEELAEGADDYDIGVLPHLWFENSPVTLLEHLALKKPVLTADIGGVNDYIRHGVNGWLFEAGSCCALKTVIESIAEGIISIPSVDNSAVNSFENCMKEITL